MPIRINLLNEALAEEELRRRDPVKRAIFIGIFLVVLSLVWFSSLWLEGKMAMQKRTQIEVTIRAHTNDFSQVQIDLKTVSEGEKRLEALQRLSANRFLTGNLLNALQQVYVPHVQLIRIKLEQGCSVTPEIPAKTDDNNRVIPGHPATSTEHASLTLDAKDSSPNPGDGVNHYKEALGKLDYFKSNLNPTNSVRLVKTSGTQTGLNGKPFILFVLECRYPEKTR
jgi:hypothetical protein